MSTAARKLASPAGTLQVTAAQHPLFTELDGEFAILNAQTGRYYTLDKVGAFLWRRVQEPTSFQTLREAVEAAYDVSPERCEADLKAFLTRLTEAGLVTLSEQNS